MRALALAMLLASCGEPFDPRVEVELDRVDGVVPVGADGRFEVAVSGCVPGLSSARATVTDLFAAGDAGASATTTIVLLGPGPNRCSEGGLSGTARLPAPTAGRGVLLEIAALGERHTVEADVMLLPAPPAGTITGIVLDPAGVPTAGGIVTARISVEGTDGAADRVVVRTLPVVPTVRDRESTSTEVVHHLAVPENVAELWVEACLGDSCASRIARAGP